MKTSEAIDILELINLAATFGTPLILNIMNNWSSDEEITPAMIAKLMTELKPADELFPELDE